LVVVRIDVSSAEGGLVLRARYLPTDVITPLFLLWWMSSLKNFPLTAPLALVVIAGLVLATLFAQRSSARSCFEAAVDEMKRRIAAADAKASSATPLRFEAPAEALAREDEEDLPGPSRAAR
jgi:hypothetical protein